MKDLGRGIFVNGFIGGNSNSTTGDTSVGITGYLFENGVPAQTVAEMNITPITFTFTMNSGFSWDAIAHLKQLISSSPDLE